MIGYFLRTLAARVRASKTLYLLTLFGVALGVASVVSIQVLNQGALLAFDGSMAAVSGPRWRLAISPSGETTKVMGRPRIAGMPSGGVMPASRMG